MRLSSISKHSTKMPDSFHEVTSNKVVAKYSLAAMRAIKKTGTIDGISKMIGSNPNDWYGIPKIDSMQGIRKWLNRVGLVSQESDKELGIILQRCIQLGIEYMGMKGFYLPSRIVSRKPTNTTEIIAFMNEMGKFTKEADIETGVILLKLIRAYYKNIIRKDSHGNKIFDSLTGAIQDKDKKFIGEIMKFFNSSTFQYHDGGTKFARESCIAKGRTHAHGTHTEFIATFDAKTLDSQVQKTVSQNLYDDAESIKDRNRMRIEVRSPMEMLQMSLVMMNSNLFKNGLSWEQKGNLFSEENEVWKNFQISYINNHFITIPYVLHLLSTIPTEKKKGNTSERQELKLISKHPSFEVQIVLIGNTNETGWNASPFYKMKADIDEEIVLRQGYITKGRILEHIKRRIPDLQKYGLPTDMSPEKIFKHFLEVDRKISPLYSQDTKIKKDTHGNIIPPNPNHTEFFTNSDFTGRAIKIRNNILPYSIWSDTNKNLYPINSGVSLSSISKISSQTQNQDRGFAMDSVTKQTLNAVLSRIDLPNMPL